MKYDFECKDCHVIQTLDLAVTMFDEVKASGVPCTSCEEGTATFKFSASGIDFCFKGDAWPDKNYKEKAYRKKRSAYMSMRQSQNNKSMTLKPNYKGQEAATWTEARDAARDDGKDTSSYVPLISKENVKRG